MLRAQSWSTIHPSALNHAFEPVRRVQAIRRPTGAIRYCCPRTGCIVLVTDAAMLAGLAERDARLRCVDCGEMHLLIQDAPSPV